MKNKKNLLHIFSQNESGISQLYQLYSEKFSQKELFWQKLSQEEKEHSEKFANLEKNLKKENGELFEDNKYVYLAIKNVSDFINQETKKARSEKISSFHALECALRIEQSMLESKSFEMFNPKIKKLKSLMEEMNREVEKHIKAIKKEIQKNQK